MAGLIMKYFVLKPGGKDIYSKASREAMRAYAKIIAEGEPQWSQELIDWADKEEQS